MSMNPSPPTSRIRARGYTVVELLVSIALGLFLVAGLVTLLVTNSINSAELNKTGMQIENGRYATQLLVEDIQHAGFLGSFSPSLTTTYALPADPCGVGSMAAMGFSNTAPITLPVAIYGWDGATTPASCTAQIPNRKPGTDIVIVRMASTVALAAAAAAAGEWYLQVLNCSTPPATPPFDLHTGATPFTLKQKDCATDDVIRKYKVRVYFVAACNVCGTDTIPTLKVSEFINGAFVTTPLVEGIENLQLLYGLDTNTDGSPECFTTDPEAVPPGEIAACPNAAAYFAAAPTAARNWSNVVTARVHVLARNVDATASWTDNRTYDLGGTTLGPFNDHYKRHVYAATARLYNISGWRENP